VPEAPPTAAANRGFSRRRLVQAGAVTAASAAVTATTGTSPASAAVTYRPARYTATAVPTAAARHLANRFSYGYTPALGKQMDRAGGPDKWFEAQLNPAAIADTTADGFATWWVSINADPATLWRRDQNGTEGGWQAMANYARWVMLRRMYSNRQVLEVMTEFWENHLHVPAIGSTHMTHRSSYGKMIRSHALGRFDEMLFDAITHPAMGIYLDNARSTAKAPNENLGRELLELHTVGVGNHTEKDVKNSARIITGWAVDMFNTWEAYYNRDWHVTGSVTVGSFTDANASSDGREVTRRYLSYLAHHPDTAQRLARKLAIRFVSDTPSQALVDHLARVYLDNGTAIKPVLRALIASTEFKGSAGQKVRTSTEDIIATYRALGVKVARPTGDRAAANAMLYQTTDLGLSPFAWARPDGQPDHNEAWSSASRLLASFRIHYVMSGGWYPTQDARYRKPVAWLPARAIRFDQLVDHLSRTLLGQNSSAALLKACCQATGVSPREGITATHAVARYKMPRLLSTILDTPAFMTR